MPENLFRRGKIWWLRATIDGVEIRESLRTGDVKAARKSRDKYLARLSSRGDRGPAKISWIDAVTAWGEHEIGQVAPTTAKRYAVSLTQCKPFLEKLADVADIDGRAIADLIAARQKAGVKHATIRRDLTAVSRVLDFCEANGWREGNPTLSKRRLLKERRDPIALPEVENIEAVIAACSARFGAFTRAAWLTGCRQNELVTAEWRAFNARAKTLEVIGKGNKRRTLKLSDAAARHLSVQPRTLGSDLIFCRDSGEAFAEAASDFVHFRRIVELRAKKEKRPFRRFRFHDLRHLYAVENLRDGGNLYDLSKHLGHTSVKTTEQVYLPFLTPEQENNAKRNTGPRPSNSEERPNAPTV